MHERDNLLRQHGEAVVVSSAHGTYVESIGGGIPAFLQNFCFPVFVIL